MAIKAAEHKPLAARQIAMQICDVAEFLGKGEGRRQFNAIGNSAFLRAKKTDSLRPDAKAN